MDVFDRDARHGARARARLLESRGRPAGDHRRPFDTVLGPGLGGVRMWPYASTDEALTDVLRLSRGMTYKAAAAGLNLGGGKAVILGDPKKDKSEALFRAFGRFVESLGGHYITAEDVGTDTADMELIATETPLGHRRADRPRRRRRSVAGHRARRPPGDEGRRAAGSGGSPRSRGRSVAIQGLGSVGCYLAGYLRGRRGARSSAATSTPRRSKRRARELGVEIVPPDEIFDVDVRRLRALRAGRDPQRRDDPAPQGAGRRRRRQQPARRAGARRRERSTGAASSTRPTT